MPQRCKACTHPKRAELNRELLQASRSLEAIALDYGMSSSALDRHKANHLKVSTQLVSEAKNAATIVGYASDLYERANRILERAETMLALEDVDSRSVQAAAATLREVRGSIELLAKLVVAAPEERSGTENSWLDAALTEAVQGLALPELPAGSTALGTGVEDAVLIDEPD